MTEQTAAVLVVDDDSSLRESLRDVGLRAKLFSSPREFLVSKLPDAPHCIVLDVRLPEQSGLDFQHELNAANIPLPIIFVTAHVDIPMSVRAMKAGAVEFLTKPFKEQELLDAVQHALDRDRANREDKKVLADLRRRFDQLTTQERTVMGLGAAGRMNKPIASEIGTSDA